MVDWKSGNVAEEELSEKAADFKKELEEITNQQLENQDAENLRKRLIKHKDELFVFLTHPYVPADNNQAERSLRPCVIHRKLMYFNTTEQGARHYELIMSLTQTAKKTLRIMYGSEPIPRDTGIQPALSQGQRRFSHTLT